MESIKDRKTKEPQYQYIVKDERKKRNLGLMSGQVWNDDPKRLCFLLSRYKFVSKMFSGKNTVLEIGCADGFGTRIVKQNVQNITAIDFDPIFIENAKKNVNKDWWIDFQVHDILNMSLGMSFEAAYALDVIEHIPRENEDLFFNNILDCLSHNGILIIGCPTLQSQIYASKPSIEGHVNCKDEVSMRKSLGKYFANTFIFSMNDELVHTGFTPMAHYIFGIGVGKL